MCEPSCSPSRACALLVREVVALLRARRLFLPFCREGHGGTRRRLGARPRDQLCVWRVARRAACRLRTRAGVSGWADVRREHLGEGRKRGGREGQRERGGGRQKEGPSLPPSLALRIMGRRLLVLADAGSDLLSFQLYLTQWCPTGGGTKSLLWRQPREEKARPAHALLSLCCLSVLL